MRISADRTLATRAMTERRSYGISGKARQGRKEKSDNGFTAKKMNLHAFAPLRLCAFAPLRENRNVREILGVDWGKNDSMNIKTD